MTHQLRECWGLFEIVFPLFQSSDVLPTIDEARRGRYGPLRGQQLDDLENSITKLRADVRMNSLRRQHAKVDQLEESKATEDLFRGATTALKAMESLVDDEVLSSDGVPLIADTAKATPVQVG